MENMDWKTFTAIPNGTQILNHGYDQCVAVANLYNEDVIGGPFVPVGSAYQWWTDYGRLPQINRNYTQSATPVAGALFVSRYGIYDAPNGHIGVITSVNANGTFNTMEQNTGYNWPQRYLYRYTRGYANVLGFLIPRKNPAAPSTQTPGKEADPMPKRSNTPVFSSKQKLTPGKWSLVQINAKKDVSVLSSGAKYRMGTARLSTHSDEEIQVRIVIDEVDPRNNRMKRAYSAPFKRMSKEDMYDWAFTIDPKTATKQHRLRFEARPVANRAVTLTSVSGSVDYWE